MKSIDITGKKFGHLTAVRFDHVHTKPSGQKAHYWLFKCDCGKETITLKNSVKNGMIISCGCKKYPVKHGMYNTRIYSVWECIKDRCLNKNNKNYKHYGLRGISICDDWSNDFMSFYNWSIKNGYKDNLTIDRIDFNGNYCPENCRWITQKEQNRNTRKNHMVSYMGKTMCISEWAEKLGIKVSTLFGRFKRGWDIEKSLMTEVDMRFSKST